MLLRIAHTYRTAFTGLSRETWLLSLVLLVNRCSTMAVPFMSMYITQRMHRSVADAGLVITLFGAGAIMGSAASGYFIDRIGFRKVQIFTSITGGLLFIGFGLIDHFPALCAMTLVLSFVVEAFRPANYAAVASYSAPQDLTRSYALNRLAMNIGWGLGTSLGGVLAAINYQLLFWVEGIAYIIVGVLVIFLLPSARPVGPAATPAQPAVKGASPWKDAFLLKFLLVTAIYSSCFILLFRLGPLYWKETLHLRESVIGLLMGLNGILIALFEMVLVRYLQHRRSSMYYITAGLVATAIGYGLLLLPGMAPLLVAVGSVIFITMGEMLALPFINSVVMGRAQEHNRGQFAAAFALTWSFAQVAGPGGGTLILNGWGYTTLLTVLVIVCLACALAFRMLSRGRQAQR